MIMRRKLAQLNDDTLREILGHLSAGDVLHCRRVCRRISQLTREHALWIAIYHRSRAPLPAMNRTLRAVDLEKLVGRAEAVDARWTNPRPAISTIHDSLALRGVTETDRTVCVGIKGSYAIFLCIFFPRDLVTFQWHKVGGPDGVSLDPIFRYDCIRPGSLDFPSDTGLDNMVSYEMDSNTGTLYIACASKSGKLLELTRIELGEKFEPQTQVFEISVWNSTSYFGVKIINGLVLCSQGTWSKSQLFEIISIQTGKKIRTLLQSTFLPKDPHPPGFRHKRFDPKLFITPRHLIWILDTYFIEVYELPDTLSTTGGSDSTHTEQVAIPPSFFGAPPDALSHVETYVFPSPQPGLLIIVGGRDNHAYLPNRSYSLILMTLDITKQSFRVLEERIINGATSESHRRFMLTHHPATHCITGIAFTTVFTDERFSSDPKGQKSLRYLKVSLDSAGGPTVVANWLDIPREVLNKLKFLESIDVYNGRLMFKSIANGQCLIGLLEYL